MVKIFPDKQALSVAAAERFIQSAREAIVQNGRFLIALSGGSTPALLYQLLAQPPYRDQVDWKKTFVFWSDERVVPPDDDGSNYKQAHELLLAHVPIPPQHVCRAQGELTPEEAAAAYRAALASISSDDAPFPRFDLILLGMGNDGHTASLFPGAASPGEDAQPVIAVTADYDGRPANRITFTPLLINRAKTVLLLVSGPDKAKMVNRALHGERNFEEVPVQRIQPASGSLLWYLDKTAASQLPTTH